jgi:hypothetical protein
MKLDYLQCTVERKGQRSLDTLSIDFVIIPMVIPEHRFLLIIIEKEGQWKVMITCQDHRFTHIVMIYSIN